MASDDAVTLEAYNTLFEQALVKAKAERAKEASDMIRELNALAEAAKQAAEASARSPGGPLERGAAVPTNCHL